MVLGPLDKRSVQTRCQACFLRHIKCRGGLPCAYCIKKNIECLPPVKSSSGFVFVLNTPRRGNNPQSIATKVGQTNSENFVSQFFSDFLKKNDFSGVYMESIVPSFQGSRSLYNAVGAIGALDRSRLESSPFSQRQEDKLASLRLYRSSITEVQLAIEQAKVVQDESALWTTFLLGIFELMYDVSGEGWLKHIMYGTSKLLQLRGPDAHRVGRQRAFFLTLRPFEICRALIYSIPSFLDEPAWRSLVQDIFLDIEPHPRERMFDILLSCSSLNARVRSLVDEHSIGLPSENDLVDAANDGLQIQRCFEEWYHAARPDSTLDAWSLLAEIYYHAGCIYLSGTFEYFPDFESIIAPRISRGDVEMHLSSIVAKSKVALERTSLAGIFLFFPLRVAGARSRGEAEKCALIEMLKLISRRNFIVADAFLLDLVVLWEGE